MVNSCRIKHMSYMVSFPGMPALSPEKTSSVLTDDESFLRKVITPINTVIEREAKKSKNGTAPHLAWCKYDDLYQYFWSADCFSLGWPMRVDGDLFKSARDVTKGTRASGKKPGRTGKFDFVDTRIFWRIFRSFDSLWICFILVLQVMVIIAWSDVSLFDIFRKDMLYKLSSICIIAAFLRFLQSIMDLALNFPGYHRWNFTAELRSILKMIASLTWSIILPLCYLHQNDSKLFGGNIKDVLPFLNKVEGIPPVYILAVALYLLPNVLAAALFIFPMLRRWIENSDWLIVRFLLWWSQPGILVERGMHESHLALH